MSFFTTRLKELLSTRYQKQMLWQCSLVGKLFLSKINRGLLPREKCGFKFISVWLVYYMGGCCTQVVNWEYLCLSQVTDHLKLKFTEQSLFNISLLSPAVFYYAKKTSPIPELWAFGQHGKRHGRALCVWLLWFHLLWAGNWPGDLPRSLSTSVILWSHDTLWSVKMVLKAGHDLLGGGIKNSAHGLEAAQFTPLGACSSGGETGHDYSHQLAGTELLSTAGIFSSFRLKGHLLSFTCKLVCIVGMHHLHLCN